MSTTKAVGVRAILEHIGESWTPPRIAPGRDPAEWEYDDVDRHDQEGVYGDPMAQPEPEYEYDQRVSW